MATGKKLIKSIDKGGCAVYLVRRWDERDYQSDRQKRNRKIVSKKLRNKLKKDLINSMENMD